MALVKYFCIPCDSNRFISIGCGAAGVWATCSPHLCRAALSARRGYLAIAMIIRAESLMDRSRARPSDICWRSFNEECGSQRH
jgi:hypothetical protein